MHDKTIWQDLFQNGLRLIDEIEKHGTSNLYWTFGGGTVLMLKYNHRFSKDIDIFVPDPQALGYVTPRLSDTAESMVTNYVEADMYVKLFLPTGEIDFVASPNLTPAPYTIETILGREVKVETPAEIIAKKFYHRGNQLQARDMFDFALVAEKEYAELLSAAPFITRYAPEIKEFLSGDLSKLKGQFEQIDVIDYHPTFEHVCTVLHDRLSEYQEKMAHQSIPVENQTSRVVQPKS